MTDAIGYFSIAWKPDISGKYTVMATFAGSNSYYGSSAQTAIFADEVPAATATPTATSASTADQYFLPVVVAIIVTVVLVGAELAILMLRKHP